MKITTRKVWILMRGLFMKSEENNTPLEIIYLKGNGEIIYRIIIIKKLHLNHIQAYCIKKHQYRTFKMDRILSVLPYEQKTKKRII